MPFSDDELIEQLAVGQLGLVTRSQLRAHGVTSHAIASRVRAKRLRTLHRGVYRVAPVAAPHARELAAVLACGPHAVLSHVSAGCLWQLVPDPGDASPVEVSLSQGDRGRRPNIRVHRVGLATDEVMVRENIPVTSVGRTLIDLAALLTGRELERALAQAERLNLLHRRDLRCLIERYAGRAGMPLLRTVLENEAGPAFTRSEAEEQFLALIRKTQLPVPESNVRVGKHEVDFFWRRERVVVEVDGFAFHASQRKFESDRRRDAWLAAQGVTVLRVTWGQVANEPEAMLVRLAQTLTRIDADRMVL